MNEASRYQPTKRELVLEGSFGRVNAAPSSISTEGMSVFAKVTVYLLTSETEEDEGLSPGVPSPPQEARRKADARMSSARLFMVSPFATKGGVKQGRPCLSPLYSPRRGGGTITASGNGSR